MPLPPPNNKLFRPRVAMALLRARSIQSDFCYCALSRGSVHPPPPPSFPTRRSSDLRTPLRDRRSRTTLETTRERRQPGNDKDRKSTRLNSSHGSNSYAVFCSNKKRKPANDAGRAADVVGAGNRRRAKSEDDIRSRTA